MIDWLLQNDVSNLLFYMMLGTNFLMGFASFKMYGVVQRTVKSWQESLKEQWALQDEVILLKSELSILKMKAATAESKKLSE